MRHYWKTGILTVVVLFPFICLLLFSLGQQWRFPELLPQAWTTGNWALILSLSDGLGQSLGLSLGVSLTMAIVSTVLSFVIGRKIAEHPVRRWLLLSAYLPYVFAPVILGACLQYFFVRFGLAGRVGGVLLAQFLICFPYGIIFFTNFWTDRMQQMGQLVLTLGGTKAQAYRLVWIPVAKRAILTCFFQLFLISWFEYGLTSLIGVGKVSTLPLQVFQYVNEANPFLAALASCLLVLPPLLLLWLNRRFLYASVHD